MRLSGRYLQDEMVTSSKDQDHNLSSSTRKKLGKASNNNVLSPREKK